jgi:hypothetical protein
MLQMETNISLCTPNLRAVELALVLGFHSCHRQVYSMAG